ncbi:MAG: hypothetical protein V1694_04290 [Candidatus Eisenbacteria bacterium]
MRQFIARGLIILGIAAFSCLYLVSVPASAQMCFRGKPAPACKTFWITEFGLGYMQGTPRPACPTCEIGLMVNYREGYAIGGTTYVAFREPFRCGPMLRVRRWMSPNWSMNFAGGPIFGRGSQGVQPGFAAHVDVNYKDWVAPYLGLDALAGGLEEGSGLHAGVRLGLPGWHPGWRLCVIGLAVAAAFGFLALLAAGTAP